MAETKKTAATDLPSFAFIGGFASGKSYYCDALKSMMEKEFGVPIHSVHIAEKIKQLARELYDMQGKDRELTNWLGAMLRSRDPEVFPKFLSKEIKKNGRLPFVVDDVRLLVDAEVLRRNFPNFVVIRIETSTEQRMQVFEKLYGRRPRPEELDDPTEREIHLIREDMALRNDYRPETPKEQLAKIVEAIKTGSLLRREGADRSASLKPSKTREGIPA